MNNFLYSSLAALATGCLTLLATIAFAHEVHLAAPPPSVATTNITTLPPLPPGVVELNFKDFFQNPVGSRGLEMTDTLRKLDGRRVRLTGYMVQEHHVARPGSFILSAGPVQLDEDEFGQCDDLPASATLVIVPSAGDRAIPHQAGRIFVTGTLSVGNQAGPGGRAFLARLTVEEPPVTGTNAVSAAAHE